MCMYVPFKYRMCLGGCVSFIKVVESNRSGCESIRVRGVCVCVSSSYVWVGCICVSFKGSFKELYVLVSFELCIGVRSKLGVWGLCVKGVSKSWGDSCVCCMCIGDREVSNGMYVGDGCLGAAAFIGGCFGGCSAGDSSSAGFFFFFNLFRLSNRSCASRFLRW